MEVAQSQVVNVVLGERMIKFQRAPIQTKLTIERNACNHIDRIITAVIRIAFKKHRVGDQTARAFINSQSSVDRNSGRIIDWRNGNIKGPGKRRNQSLTTIGQHKIKTVRCCFATKMEVA